MPTKIVHVSAEHHCTTDAMDILSPKALNKLLDEGYSIIKRKKVTLKHPKTGKQATVDELQIATASEERGVATVKPERGVRPRVPDAEAPGHELSLSRPDNGSYLGGGSVFGGIMRQTGIQVGSNMAGDAAYGMGVDCAKLGGLASENPFPAGSVPHREWMNGFGAGGGDMPVASPPEALEDAFKQGKITAKRAGKDTEVSCPYPQGTDLYSKWLEGFEAGGGTIE